MNAAQRWRTDAHQRLSTDLAEVLGGATADTFAQRGLHRVWDLLTHLPRRHLASAEMSDLGSVRDGDDVALVARVETTAIAGYHPRLRVEAVIGDGRGTMRVTFFGAKRHVEWWTSQLEKGDRGLFVGRVSSFQRRLQLTHPDFVMLDAAGNVVGRGDRKNMVSALSDSGLVGLYPAWGKLPTWTVAESVRLALDHLGSPPDTLPAAVVDRHHLVSLPDAFRGAHRPASREEIGPATHRLVFEEAFGVVLAMAVRRRLLEQRAATSRPAHSDGLLAALDRRLPFQLTEAQRRVSEEIFADLARTSPMHRLLQGEVGSGKTLVALRAMAATIDAGGQAVLMAPTEVLAQQHAETLRSMLGPLAEGSTLQAGDHATTVDLLTGSVPAAARREVVARVRSGATGILVGTHAVLSRDVEFHDLGLVVVDEQHRFGVAQRSQLSGEGDVRPHVLVMTATPIPRSVALTLFGDLDVSHLDELPPGRSDVQTTVVDTERHPAWVERAWQRVREEVAAGRQCFVVAPRIDPEDAPRASVVGLMEELGCGPLSGLRLGMLHGRLSTDAKRSVMQQFTQGALDVLVSTTVVEVGVDVPNATVMVVVDADSFGVSQLHQLRGRIGRGSHKSVCLLFTSAPVGTPARERLEAVASTRDGFALAEVDLEQRREGDVLGADQSGVSASLRMLRVTEHQDVIEQAREAAESCLRDDPELNHPGLADAVARVEELAQHELWGGS